MSLIWITLLSMVVGMSMGALMFNYLTAGAANSSHLDATLLTSTSISISTTGASSLALPQATTPRAAATEEEEEVVAYAITITNCTDPTKEQQKGKGGSNHHDALLDMATVLKHSIHLTSLQNPSSGSHYDYQMYAFLHEDAKKQCSKLAPSLKKLGYRVQWRPTPFSLDDISDEHEFVKTKIQKQGCCGAREFLKLYTLQLTNHKIAVHLDLDSILFKPMDHLYNAMLNPDDNDARNQVYKDQQPQQQAEQPNLPEQILSYFTRDYNMAIANIQPSRVLMQGGFWIVRTNQTTFQDIVSLITNHADLYDKDCGWGGCSLGSARLYGGAGFQGVISYYYTYYMHNRGHNTNNNNKQEKTATTTQPDPSSHSFVELDRCYYNSMADKARKACYKEGNKDVVACNNCNEVGDFSEIYGAHLTLCQKPRLCGPYHGEQLCYRYHHAWHAIRADWERKQQQQEQEQLLLELDDPEPDDNPRNRYAQRIVKKFPNHCQKLGEKGYIPLDLPL